MARISCAPIESVTFLRTSFGPNRLITPSTARMGCPTDMQISLRPRRLVRAAGGELVEVLLVDAVHRHELILLYLIAVEMRSDLLCRDLGLFGRDLCGCGELLAGLDVDHAVLHAVAADDHDTLVRHTDLQPR